MEERLQKFLARAGVASRRASEQLILDGRVAVNGGIVRELGVKVDPESDGVTVDGKAVVPAGEKVYLAMHKPAGYITTVTDPFGRPTVMDLVPDPEPGLFPVGRLDEATEGLLLLTNDGDLGHQLMHPRHHVRKTYLVEVFGQPSEEELQRLREGVDLDDGRTLPAEVRLLAFSGGVATMELTIRQGKKRQIRRMLSAVGHPVRRLLRTRFGPIELGSLKSAKVRELNSTEVEALRKAAAGEE